MEKKTLQYLVDALRSGKYLKGVGALQRKIDDGPGTFCCEGVMCEISGVKVVGWGQEDDETGTSYAKYSLPGSDGTWSSFAPAFVWLDTPMGTNGGGEVAEVRLPIYDRGWSDQLVFSHWDYVTLASLNDFNPRDTKNAFTFDQIADLIQWAYLTD